MKKTIIAILLLTFPLMIIAQTATERDSLVEVMCADLDDNGDLPDSLRIMNIFGNHLPQYLADVPENEADSILMGIYIRLQRNCPEFVKILSKENKGDWEMLKKEDVPEIKASKKDCRYLAKSPEIYYLEDSGEKVIVELNNRMWVDKFEDGTHSKLSIKWLDDCECELKFIESNNEVRNHLSNVGDKYNYKIIEKKSDFFVVIASVPDQDMFMKFKVYYE